LQAVRAMLLGHGLLSVDTQAALPGDTRPHAGHAASSARAART